MTDVTLRMLLFGEDRSASKSMEGVGNTAEKTSHVVSGAFSKLGNVVGGEVGDIANRVSEALNSIGEVGHTVGAKATAAGIGIAGIGAALATIGSGDKQAEASLEAAFEGAGATVDDFKGKIEEVIKQQENYGNSAKSTQGALATLTQATQDPAKALKYMGVVANIAASKHISLNTAATQVAQSLSGKGRLFTQFGVTVQKGADGTKDYAKALDDVAHRASGQAAASVDSFSGKFKVLGTHIEDDAAALGAKYGPALTAAGSGLTAVATVLELVSARTAAKAAATAADAAATTADTAASGAAAVATGILGAAMDALPIFALIAGIVLVVTHWHQFEAAGKAALDAVGNAAMTAWGWIKGHWPLILGILTGPIGLAVGEIAQHWDQILNGLSKAKSAIGKVAVGMWDGIKDAFVSAINFIIRGWNSIHLSLPSVDTHIPGVGKVGGFTLSVPQMPLLAAGGIVTSPTVAMIGEAGPEAVIPLSAGRNRGLGGGDTIHVTVNGFVGNESQLAREIEKVLTKTRRERGGAALAFQ